MIQGHRTVDSRWVQHLTCALLALSLCSYGRAQPAQIRFAHISSDDGLYSLVADILQDRNGFMWFRTAEELARFDGYGFTHYKHDPNDPDGLPDGVHHLLEDRRGDLWAGAAEGLFRYDPVMDGFRPYRPISSAQEPIEHIAGLFNDGQGHLWVSTAQADAPRVGEDLYRLSPETGYSVRYSLDARHQYPAPERVRPVAFHQDRQGRLWVGAWGLLLLDPQTGSFETYLPDSRRPRYDPEASPRLGNAITTILDDGAGGLWVGTLGNGLYRFDPDVGSFTQSYVHVPGDPQSLSHNSVSVLFEDRSGQVWVGTRGGGLNHFDPETGIFTAFKHDPADPHSLGSDQVFSIYEDRLGVLWVGTSGGGVSYFDRSKPLILHYQHDPTRPTQSLSSNRLWGIFEDSQGALWIAAVGEGINRFDRATGTWTHFRHDPGDPASLGTNSTYYFQEDRDGTVWVGAEDGLYSYDRATNRFTHHPHLANTRVVHLLIDRTNILWSDSNDGLLKIDPATRTLLARYPPESEPSSILEDHEGTIWLAADGVTRFDRETETFTRFHHDPEDPNSLSSDWVYHIEERRQEPGILWVSTYGGGLNRLDTATGRVVRFTEQNSGLPDNQVYAALADEEGHLWISTDNGLARFNPETGVFKIFGVEDGLQSVEFNVQSYHRSQSGEMFFGGGNGFNAFIPSEINDNPYPPEIVLNRFSVFDEPIPIGSPLLPNPLHVTHEITLAYNQNDVSFDYVGLHFSSPQQNRYRYILEGYDATWREAGTRRQATYTNLRPSTYTFRVQAANSDGVWNEDGASVNLTILPPWWKTRWAYVLYGLVGIAGVFAANRFQRRRLIHRERQRALLRELEQTRKLEAINAELRQKEQQLEAQNRTLSELDELKSRFFANISHEFRTPLTLLLGPLTDALTPGNDPARLLDQAPFMQRSARRLMRLVNQLLDLSGLEAGRLRLRLEWTNLDHFLRQLVLAFGSRAERAGVTLLYEGPDEGACAGAVDRDKLEQVVINLLSNAFKFTPRGGTIRVSLRPKTSEDDAVEAWAEIIVEDTGVGIPPEALPKIFDRFYQVDSSMTRTHAGSGIGLALTKELVELHGGTIAAASHAGGTSFTVVLPLGAAPEESESADPRSGGGSEARFTVEQTEGEADSLEPTNTISEPSDVPNGPTVLVVDDNDDMRAYLGGLLRAQGYRVAEARDGQEGLEQAQAQTPDLVISDIMMPFVDGVELCRTLKASPQLGHVPVVLLTARAAEDDLMEGLGAGADDYLAKPFNAEELLLRTENLIEIRRQLRERFSDEVRLGPSPIVVSSQEAAFVERVRQVVEPELSNSQLTMEQVAAAVGLSLRQLHRRLKEGIGLTPAGYVRMLRMERAAHLLGQRADTVSGVADAVGFNDVSHFSRLFKQTHGVLPSQYTVDVDA